MRSPATCRHAPVDVARIVAGDVGAHLLELEPPSALRARMGAEQRHTRSPAAVQRQSLRRAAQRQQLVEIRNDHGAGTRLNSSSMQACAVTPRACAA
jgi:hypothetical protein